MPAFFKEHRLDQVQTARAVIHAGNALGRQDATKNLNTDVHILVVRTWLQTSEKINGIIRELTLV